jgi:two-component system CheB/CheR fusion protein
VGVRQEEVQGQHFLNLDIGLPVDQVRPALRRAMSAEDGSRPIMVDATNRRGRPVRCRVTCSPLVGNDKVVRGVIVVMEPQPDGQPATGVTGAVVGPARSG